MRSLFALLDTTNDAWLISQARNRMRDPEFISFGRTFLSILAVAGASDLEDICSRLLPHQLTFEPSTSTSEISQATQDEPIVHLDYARGFQPPEVFRSEISSQLLVTPAPQPTAMEMFDRQDIYSENTTLGDYLGSMADNPAGIGADVSDCHNIEIQDNAKRLTGNSSTSNLMSLNSRDASNTPNIAPTAGNLNISAVDHVADSIHACSPTQFEHHTKSASPAPSQISSNWTLSPVVGSMYHFPELSTHYHRSFDRLGSLYGGHSKNAVKNINYVIQLGDSFLRTDAASFIETLCDRWDQEGLWYRPALSNPARDGSVMKRLLRGFHCAEVLQHGSIVDAFRLRISRVLLYQYYAELFAELQTSPSISYQRPSGKKTASVATDKILDELYSAHSEQFKLRTRKQWQDSLRRHKKLGKRWSILATYFGLGVFLTCSTDLETKMNNPSFTERMILALVTYVRNVYPQGIQISQKLDPFVKGIMDGDSPPFSELAADSLSEIDNYKQEEEKERYKFGGEWQPIVLPEYFFRIE